MNTQPDWPARHMITSFRGTYAFLSNFYPCIVHLSDGVYPSLEHAYQAAKFERDSLARKLVANAHSPGLAKRMGRRHPPAAYWNEAYKLEVMRKLVNQKFSAKNPTLLQQLVETGDAMLIEGNTWGDTFWGVCNGSGLNHLGRLLMERRAAIIASNPSFYRSELF